MLTWKERLLDNGAVKGYNKLLSNRLWYKPRIGTFGDNHSEKAFIGTDKVEILADHFEDAYSFFVSPAYSCGPFTDILPSTERWCTFHTAVELLLASMRVTHLVNKVNNSEGILIVSSLYNT